MRMNQAILEALKKIYDSILIFLQSWYVWLMTLLEILVSPWFQSLLFFPYLFWLAVLCFFCRLLFLCSTFLIDVGTRPKSFAVCTLPLTDSISSTTKFASCIHMLIMALEVSLHQVTPLNSTPTCRGGHLLWFWPRSHMQMTARAFLVYSFLVECQSVIHSSSCVDNGMWLQMKQQNSYVMNKR